MTGIEKVKQDILIYVKNTKKPYLSPSEVDRQGWLAGASHCTVRRLMLSGKIPSIKVGTALRAHYQDILEYLEKSYKNKSL